MMREGPVILPALSPILGQSNRCSPTDREAAPPFQLCATRSRTVEPNMLHCRRGCGIAVTNASNLQDLKRYIRASLR
jgi:hypothetical protein